MDDLIETRWQRYGNDRVYVKTAAGAGLGYLDLVAKTINASCPTHVELLEQCLRRWTAEPSAAPPIVGRAAQAAPIVEDEPPPDVAVVSDLTSNAAGARVQARRDELHSKAPVRYLIARMLGVDTPDRSWRVGALGEQKVGRVLDKLGAGWHVLHSVEVGNRGSDIDHVLIGPGGVFTLNTKTHPRGNIWVGEHAVRVSGQPTDYLRNSRFEAQRATRLLSAACGFAVAVTPALVFVDVRSYTTKGLPHDVHVLRVGELRRWVSSREPVLDAAQVEEIFAHACRRATWVTKPRD